MRMLPTVLKAAHTRAPTASDVVHVSANTASASTQADILATHLPGFFRFKAVGDSVGLLFGAQGSTVGAVSLTSTTFTAASIILEAGEYVDLWITAENSVWRRIANGTTGTFRITKLGD